MGLLLDAPRATDKRHSVRCSPPRSTPTDRASERRASGAAGPVPPDRRQTFWSNSDIHFDIVHRRGKKNKPTKQTKTSTAFLPPKSNEESQFGFPSNTRHFPTVTVHEQVFPLIQCFFLLFADLLDCG